MFHNVIDFILKSISMNQDLNQMSIENLALIWGPILIDSGLESVANTKDDLYYSCKVIELVIRNVHNIFEI